MPVSSINNPSGTTVDPTTGTPVPATASNTLNQQDFLQLLATQFQQQDPLKPMDDSSFLAQMAQFTSLQQVNTLTDQVTQLRTDQQKVAAAAYFGRTVTMDDGNGGTVSGAVTAVDTSGTTPQLQVNNTYYPLSSLLSIDQPAPSSGTTQPSA